MKEAKEQSKKQPQPPLVRLKVIYSGKWLNIPVRFFFNFLKIVFLPINGRRFGARYGDFVANPSEMLVVRSNRLQEKKDNGHESINVLLDKNINSIHNVEQMVGFLFKMNIIWKK